jgi:hypothetical protein
MKIKSKSEMAKSPDYADAAVFCCLRDDHIATLSGQQTTDNVMMLDVDDNSFYEHPDPMEGDPWLAYFPLD